MAVTPAVLIEAVYAAAADTSQYASPTSVTTIVDKFTATNTDTSTRTLNVNLVVSGGSASAANLVVSAKALQPGETYTFPEIVGQILASGDFISTNGSVANKIVLRAAGRQVTA